MLLLTLRNAVIPWVGNWVGSSGVGKTYHSQEKVGFDLSLDLGKFHRKFGDAGYYRDQMHEEQTNILLYIYTDDRGCLVQLFCNVILSPSARPEYTERPIFTTTLQIWDLMGELIARMTTEVLHG